MGLNEYEPSKKAKYISLKSKENVANVRALEAEKSHDESLDDDNV